MVIFLLICLELFFLFSLIQTVLFNGNLIAAIAVNIFFGAIISYVIIRLLKTDEPQYTTKDGIYILIFLIILFGGTYLINQFFGVVFTFLYFVSVILIGVFSLYLKDYKTITEDEIQSDNLRYIPSEVKKEVWVRDGGQCVICRSKRHLEFDHDIPISKGGSNTANNIRILCRECNRSKSGKIE
jgi:hypothetical protein